MSQVRAREGGMEQGACHLWPIKTVELGTRRLRLGPGFSCLLHMG